MIVSRDIGRRTLAAVAIAGAASMTALGVPSTAAAQSIEIPLRDMVREIWPLILVPVAALLVMVLASETVLWLPRQFGYGQ